MPTKVIGKESDRSETLRNDAENWRVYGPCNSLHNAKPWPTDAMLEIQASDIRWSEMLKEPGKPHI